MRRLPIFIVLDVSESMAGEPIKEVRSGLQLLTDALMSDPFALETVHISVIAFAGKAKTIVPLTYILDFEPPELPVGSGTNLTEALHLLMHEIDTNVKKNTPDSKGDWKPLVFILTDGSPNDDYKAATAQWKMKYGKYQTVAVLMGEHSDATALKAVTDNVLVFKDTTKESYQAFFKWVSFSIQTSSKAIGEQGRETPENFDKIRENMEKDLLADNLPTENNVEFFVIPARCQKNGKPYIVRYVRKGNAKRFVSDGSYPVDESYLEFSGSEKKREINLEKFDDTVPECPYCHATILGFCSCGNALCLTEGHLQNVKCPHCGVTGDFGGPVTSIAGGRG